MCECARLLLFAALPAIAGWGCVYVDGETVSGGGGGPEFAREASEGSEGGSGRARGTGVLGETVALHCSVMHLADRSISWVRSRDLQILSHAGAVFTADARVSVHVARVDDVTRHTLRIDALRRSDAGGYECQVNTEPKMSLFYNLTVYDEPPSAPVVKISGPRSVSAAAGHSAQLTCRATLRTDDTHAPPPTLDVHWVKDDQLLTLQSGLGGVSLDTERWSGRATSRLSLAALTPQHAGTYSCVAADTSDSVRLHVVDNDTASQMEAMQRDQSPELFNTAPHGHAQRWIVFTALVTLPYLLIN